MYVCMYGATGENRNCEYKEDKATTQILNLRRLPGFALRISYCALQDGRRKKSM